MATLEVVKPLDALSSSVADILRLLKRAGPDFESTMQIVRVAIDALGTAGTLVRHETPLTPADAARFSGWLHEVRGPVHAMAGWAHLLGTLNDEARRQRAREVIAQNARLLQRLLAEPPR